MPQPMHEQLLAQPAPARRRSRWGMVLVVAVLAFLLGGGAVGWLAWHDGLSLAGIIGMARPDAGQSGSGRDGASPLAAHATLAGAPAPMSASDESTMETRIMALEQRLDRLDMAANAEEANTARAEALLVAFATRRATERGAPLGYLEDQVKLRFGDALPNAVGTVIAAEKAPVTLDQLAARLQAMAPALTGNAPGPGGWAQLRASLANLFVLHRAGTPSPAPASRLDHAEMCLREGRIDDAIADVQRLPGAAASSSGAGNWIAAARHYAEVEQALDLMETTALLEPDKLRDGKGRAVTQPSPFAPSSPPGDAPRQP